MSANWWEIGKPVQDIDIISAKDSIAESDTEDKAKQNWWEIGRPVEEPAQTEAAPVQPVPTTPGQGAGRSFQDLFGAPVTPQLAASYKAVSEPPLQSVYGELERQAIEEGKTSNVLVGGVSRAQDILGNLLEGTSRIPSAIPETAYATSPILGGVKAGLTAVAPGLQGAAERFKEESEKVNYSYGTQLKELADNPLNVVPFVLERFSVSIPDMASALYAAPAYIVSLTNETLNERLKNDGRNFEDATVADVAAAGASAVLQSKLEKFATARFGRAETILGETAIQGGTEAIQEIGQYVAQTAGTKAGFDPTTAGLIGLEAGIAGGGIGLTFAGVQDFAQRRIEARVRGNEELGSQIENNILDELRNQAFEKAKSISAPELNKIPIGAGQTEATPVQYGDAYAQKIYDTIGNYIPVNAEFKVEEKTIDGAPKFIVTDKTGTQYGQNLDSRDRADSLSLSLNNTTRGRAEVIKQLEPLQSSLSDALKGFGLNDVGLSINNRIFTRRGEALTSEGLFDPVVRRVFLAVDAVDPQGNLDTNQRREALRGVLRHEVVHALRYLDLWKRSEWKNLEGAASNLKKPGTDKTYLQIAQENYADQNKVIQVEESVADLIRDVAGNISRVAGKPRNLSERAINFFDKTKNALTGAGFQTYEDVVRRFEQGAIGARERGRIRTFRATEERLAEQGQLPDRVQRLFATPQDRNQFRQETVQKVQQETPAVAVPAINSLRLNAVRESRSTIDPVPPKITVDEQEVPTRDSEGRLIYSGFEGPEVFNTPTRPTMDGLRNFWNWFGSSKAVDNSKRPLVYYHGTAADITAFQPKQAGSVFLTRSPRFAEEFSALSQDYMVENFTDFMSDEQVIDALNETLQRSSAFTPSLYDRVAEARDKAVAEVSAGKAIRPGLLKIFKDTAAGGSSSRYLDAIQKRLPSGANLIPVYVRAEKPWDYGNKDDIKAVVKRARDNGADITASMVEEIGQGNWQTIEGSDGNAPILDAIRELGYDSMFVEEGGQKNLAVFDPGQIKSAIGNNGDFSPLTPSIRESRKEPTYNIVNSRTGEVVGQANTIGGARRAVDRRDNQYGAYVHTIQTVDPERDIAARNVARERLGIPPIERESRVPREKTLDEIDSEIAALDAAEAVEREKISEVESFARRAAQAAFDFQRDYSDLQDSIDSSRENIRETLKEDTFGPNSTKYEEQAFAAYDAEVEKLKQRKTVAPSIRESRKFPAKSTPEDAAMAQEYLNRTGELPYLSEGQLEPIVPVARQSIKKPYEAKDLAKGKENDPILGLPLNKNGTVTLYYPATNEAARRTIQDKRLKGSTPTSNRIYLTNESSGPKVMQNPGNIDQPMDGANVLIQVDPSLLHIDQEYEDGRKDFFIQLAEGESYAKKMKQTKLFTLDAPRTRALSKDTKLVDIERSISDSVTKYLALDAKGKRARLKQARDVLKKEHNVGTLMGENGKLQKTRIGDYGLTYDGKSVASMGLGLASAQRINEQNLSTCPKSAICEGLCLGETSGQNLLYGGEGQFKSGPRLSQYLKTEAIVQNSEDFAIVLYDEIAKFEKWSNSETGVEQVENEAGEQVMQPKQIYQPAIRLNVTSDFRPQTFAAIINAFPNVMFYDYTKLPTRSIAPNHHLTYSSTGASQIVNGETIVNPETNWDRMVQQLNNGMNVAMAFTSRTDMPDFVVDERTGQRFQVWDGDNYDARFLDPKREDGIGMIVGLTNKDKTTKPEDAAKKYKGFFLDYDRARDGDALVIPNQGRLRIGAAPQGPVAEAARPPAAREARRRGTPIGPTQPGPTNDTDNTSAAEALNDGQPLDSIGTPTGPTISDTEPDGTVDISGARIAPLTRRIVVQMIQSAPDKLRSGLGLDDLAKRIENYYDTYASRLGVANGIIRDAFKRIDLGGKTAALTTFEEFIRARENGRTEDAQSILDMATDSERQLIDAWNEIARQTGEINTSIRTPDGKPMRVWDAKRNEWRPIRSVRNFFPRAFRREVMEVMQNPDLDPVLWQSLLDSLVEEGLAETTRDAENYLLREWFSDEVAQDYFAGVEKARTEPLPEIFYDYSWDAATRYLRKWSRRTAQIENFGQTIGKFQKEWFDKNIPKVRDQETQNYLNSIKERIYEIEQFNALTNMANWANSLATAVQLGNPVSASLNLLGGTITNVQDFGIKEIAKSYANLVLDWKNVQNEGTTLGILNKDFMNILNDHVEMDADKYFSKEQKISQALAKFSNFMLTVGGFNGAENIVRSSAMLAARARLNSFLNDVRNGSENDSVKRFREWVKRENLDVDSLILEDGAGKETEKFMRRAVNVPQGSYSIDMTPVFIDSAAGRFLLKYQKFGTQVNRFFYNHFLKVFYDNPTPRNFMRVAGFVGSAIIGGEAISAIREAFGYGDPGPDDEEIKKAFENEDTARGWSLIFSRAWQNIMTAGSLGFFANYAQFAKDWQDQQRVKNPFSPPGLASVDAVIDVFNRLRDQKKMTARDLDEIAETTLSFYRANKRIGLAAMDAIGSDAREVRRFAAQKEIREVREYGRRYSEAMEIEFKQRTAPGAVVRTPMTPVNKAITDALQQGDAARARLLVRKAVSGLRGEERDRVEASIRASVRNRQPIQIGGSAPSQQELQAFMRWSRQNLPAEKYQMIRRADMRYRRAASRAGMGIGD
jgi:hypothetical protein